MPPVSKTISVEIFCTRSVLQENLHVPCTLIFLVLVVVNSSEFWSRAEECSGDKERTRMKNSTEENGDETNDPSRKPLVNNTPLRFI